MGRHPCVSCGDEDWDYSETHCPNDNCEYGDGNELCLSCFEITYPYMDCEAKGCERKGCAFCIVEHCGVCSVPVCGPCQVETHHCPSQDKKRAREEMEESEKEQYKLDVEADMAGVDALMSTAKTSELIDILSTWKRSMNTVSGRAEGLKVVRRRRINQN
jgi:hypothetical protein